MGRRGRRPLCGWPPPLYRPLSILWDGPRDLGRPGGLRGRRGGPGPGRPRIVASRRSRRRPPARAAAQVTAAGGPAGPARQKPGTDGGWLAEVGVGVVHCTPEVAARLAARGGPGSRAVVGLHQALKARFDPDGRLNPGRSPLAAVAGVTAVTCPASGLRIDADELAALCVVRAVPGLTARPIE